MVPKFDHYNDNTEIDNEEDEDVYRCKDDNEYDNDNDELIPEDDWKKFGFFTMDEIHEIREAEMELIFQSLKKIVHGDHLSQKVEENILGGFSKMLDLENSNITHIDTRAAEVVNTTVNPEVMKTTEPSALDVEEEHVNITMPSTAVSVPDSVKELTEADLRTANITGEI